MAVMMIQKEKLILMVTFVPSLQLWHGTWTRDLIHESDVEDLFKIKGQNMLLIYFITVYPLNVVCEHLSLGQENPLK